MFIFDLLKWLSYISSGLIILLFCIRFVFKLMDCQIPVNHTTKTCLITGASSWLGRAPASEMVNSGRNVSAIDHQKIMATNYLGVVAWVDEWINDAKAFGVGTFAATSSIAALGVAIEDVAAYGASKIALLSCFKALRLQYLSNNIGFSVIFPGDMVTNFNPEFYSKVQSGYKLSFIHRLFVHFPEDYVKYIVDQVFKGNKQIEPSWLLSTIVRLINCIR